VFAKEKADGDFAKEWSRAVDKAGLSKVDMSVDVGLIMAPKEEAELNVIKKSAQVTVDVFSKYLKDTIIGIIDGDKVCVPVFISRTMAGTLLSEVNQ
jgi:nucleosome binding factor SPN SPT16 subunit